MLRMCPIFVLLSLLFLEGASLAQSTDSLVMKKRLLQQENKRYIQMAERDRIISASQADSLQKVTTGTVEKPIQLGIDILFQIRDYIDYGYEEQMKIVNEPAMEEHYYSAHTMLPTKLSIPEDIVFPEEREAELQKLAMEQMAESIARDFEREKLPDLADLVAQAHRFLLRQYGLVQGDSYIHKRPRSSGSEGLFQAQVV